MIEAWCEECDCSIDMNEEIYCHRCWMAKDEEIELFRARIDDLENLVEELIIQSNNSKEANE